MAKKVVANLSSGAPGGVNPTWTKVDGSEAYRFSWTGEGRSVSLFKAFGGEEGGTLDWSEGTQL
ncbi:MAG: hypothetical protein MSA13_02735, partial [Prevotella sp.]|nr:hypothetical protein [Prevotella sp.]